MERDAIYRGIGHAVNLPEPFVGQSISVSHLERLRRFVASLVPLESADLVVERGPGGCRARLKSRRHAAEDLQLAFVTMLGAGSDAGKIVVSGGFVEHHSAGGTTYHEVQATKLTPSAGYNLICVEWVIGGAASVALVTAVAEAANWAEALASVASDATHVRVPLAGWKFAAGAVERGPTWHVGNVQITPVVAP